jgi:multidrug resistance efflux pump
MRNEIRRFAMRGSVLGIGLVAALAVGCNRKPETPSPPAHEHADAPTNRVEISAAVRQNLGINFAKVDKRAVSRTLRLPGRFELLPTATREYRAAGRGKVELLVEQHASVKEGQALFRLDLPRLRELQQQLAEAEAGVTMARAKAESMPALIAAHERHHQEVDKSIAMWEARVKQLEELRVAGGGRAEELATANSSLSAAKAQVAEVMEKEAELAAQKAEGDARLAAGKRQFELLIGTLAALTGDTAEQLLAVDAGAKTARWQAVSAVEVKAAKAGVVAAFGTTNGAWVEESQLVLTVIAPDQLRFQARGLQSDLGRLAEGQAARIVPPVGTSAARLGVMEGTLRIAPRADAESRTIELFCIPTTIHDWAKPGVAGFVEITTAGAGEMELAIPLSCVVRDGLKPIIFRRDPKAPDRAIRMEADLGIDDGRWVVIKSGVAEGDEIVLEGAYQLLVATSGTIQKGGHFHADGTFHEGDD